MRYLQGITQIQRHIEVQLQQTLQMQILSLQQMQQINTLDLL